MTHGADESEILLTALRQAERSIEVCEHLATTFEALAATSEPAGAAHANLLAAQARKAANRAGHRAERLQRAIRKERTEP